MPASQDKASPVAMFWLKTGQVPAGPYTAAQVYGEMAAGRATWQTPACPVGDYVFRPLHQTPGVRPVADVGPTTASPASDDAPHDPNTLPDGSGNEPAAASPAGRRFGEWVYEGVVCVVGVLMLFGLIWGVGWVLSQFDSPTAAPPPAMATAPPGADVRSVPAQFPPSQSPAAPASAGAQDATLAYWAGLNSLPAQMAQHAKDGPDAQAWAYRRGAGVIRESPTLGIDPDAVRWALRMADLLENRADLIDRARNPALVAEAFVRGLAGDPFGVTIEMTQAERAFVTAYRTHRQDWERVRAALTARYGVQFP